MSYLLVVHILLGTMLLLAFVVRYLGVLARKIEPTTGRSFITVVGVALVASGVALGVVYKAPITNACLSALGIIVTIIALEYALQHWVYQKPSPHT